MKQLTFTFSVDQAQTILSGLSKLPYEQSASVIAELQKQATPQMAEKAPAIPVVESNGNTPE